GLGAPGLSGLPDRLTRNGAAVPGQHRQRDPGSLLPDARSPPRGGRLLQRLVPSVQSALESYARGVNEVIGLANATGNLPPEYVSLNISHIEPWVPVDSVVFGKLQAFQLSFDFDDGLTGDLASVTGALGPATG